MSKRKLLVKIAGSWFRVTALDGIQVDTGEQFSNLFLDELQGANIICTNCEEPKQAQQQPNFDVIAMKIQLINTFISHCAPSEATAEQAVRFANTVIENILKSN